MMASLIRMVNYQVSYLLSDLLITEHLRISCKVMVRVVVSCILYPLIAKLIIFAIASR